MLVLNTFQILCISLADRQSERRLDQGVTLEPEDTVS